MLRPEIDAARGPGRAASRSRRSATPAACRSSTCPGRSIRRRMALGVITGSGTYSLPGFEGGSAEPVSTEWGEAFVSSGRFAGVEVLHVSRHGEGHVRLSNHVT